MLEQCEGGLHDVGGVNGVVVGVVCAVVTLEQGQVGDERQRRHPQQTRRVQVLQRHHHITSLQSHAQPYRPQRIATATARLVCAAGLRKCRASVRPYVWLSLSAVAADLLLRARLAGDRPIGRSSSGVRRANTGSAMLSADVGS